MSICDVPTYGKARDQNNYDCTVIPSNYQDIGYDNGRNKYEKCTICDTEDPVWFAGDLLKADNQQSELIENYTNPGIKTIENIRGGRGGGGRRGGGGGRRGRGGGGRRGGGGGGRRGGGRRGGGRRGGGRRGGGGGRRGGYRGSSYWGYPYWGYNYWPYSYNSYPYDYGYYDYPNVYSPPNVQTVSGGFGNGMNFNKLIPWLIVFGAIYALKR